MNILITSLGISGIITWLLSIQNKKKKKILIYQIIANSLYFVQYFLLGAPSAYLINLLSIIRYFVFYLEEEKFSKTSNTSFILFTIATIIIGIFTYNGWLSLLPIISSLIFMYAIWQKNLTITRILFIIDACIWVCHNFIIGAYINIVGNTLGILSGIISIIRFRRK